MSARLIAEIGADTRPFEDGLNRAEAAADRFSHKLSKKLDKAFGIGFLAGLVAHIPSKLMEAADKISEGAARLHTTAEGFQAIAAAASKAGLSVEEYVKQLEKAGKTVSGEMPRIMRDNWGGVKVSNQDVGDWANIKSFLGKVGGGLLRGAATVGSGVAQAGNLIKAIGMAPFGDSEYPLTDFLKRGAGDTYLDDSSDAFKVPEDRKRAAKMRQFKILEDMLKFKGKGFKGSTESLEDEAIRIRREEEQNKGGSFWSPSFTNWQEAGAYKQTPQLLISDRDSSNQRLENIADEVRNNVKEAEKNRDKLEEVKQEISKLRGEG